MNPFVVFRIDDRRFALPAAAVHEVVAMPELVRPEVMPDILAGLLNFDGALIPVVRIHRLLSLATAPVRLYTPLLVLKPEAAANGMHDNGAVALLVDEVSELVMLSEEDLAAADAGHAVNDCIDAVANHDGASVCVLRPERLLLEAERARLDQIRLMEEERIRSMTATAESEGRQ